MARNKRKNARRARAKTLSKLQKRQVVSIVKGEAETKRSCFYQQYNDGTITTRCPGVYSARGWATQNQSIQVNQTDILQLIPFIQQGTDDWERIGREITPRSLTVKGAVRIAFPRINANLLTNVKVHIFVYQHVSLKDYQSLYSQNSFQDFLYAGQGATTLFNGEEQCVGMPVNKQVYKIVKKLVIPLKFAGLFAPGTPSGQPNPNSHQWKADFSFDLTKHLPKRLVYPQNNVLAPLPITQLDTPTNSSLAMSMGFTYDLAVANTNGTPFAYQPWLEQTYVSQLTYKDL